MIYFTITYITINQLLQYNGSSWTNTTLKKTYTNTISNIYSLTPNNGDKAESTDLRKCKNNLSNTPTTFLPKIDTKLTDNG